MISASLVHVTASTLHVLHILSVTVVIRCFALEGDLVPVQRLYQPDKALTLPLALCLFLFVACRMIEESLKNWFTKLNFFIHNLGQLGSSTAAVESPILSFCPRNFTYVLSLLLRCAEFCDVFVILSPP